MSGEQRRSGAPQGPPWSLDLLADLHAGVLDQDTADQLRVQVQDDPEAREVLAALDATSADLAALPPLTIPDDVSAHIDAALENEVRAWARHQAPAQAPAPAAAQPDQPPAQVVDLAAERQRRRRRFAQWTSVAASAAAVVAGVVFAMNPANDATQQQAQQSAVPSHSAAPLALQGDKVTLSGQQLSEALKSDQYLGAFSDPQRLLACLQANGVRNGKPTGAREITLNGRPAQLVVLPSGKIGQFRLLAVRPDCGPGNPATLSDTTVGG